MRLETSTGNRYRVPVSRCRPALGFRCQAEDQYVSSSTATPASRRTSLAELNLIERVGPRVDAQGYGVPLRIE